MFYFDDIKQRDIKNNNTINSEMEMNLTDKEISLIAFEAEGVNPYSPKMVEEFSYRTQGFILKASKDPSYVVRRCYFLRNGVKL